MKFSIQKILLFCFCLMYSTLAKTEPIDSTEVRLNQNMWLAGLSASFASSERATNDFSTRSMRAVSEIHRLISDRMMIGVGVGYAQESGQFNFMKHSIITRFNTRIISPVKHNVFLFAQAEVGLDFGESRVDESLQHGIFEIDLELYSTFRTYHASLKPGVMYLPSKRWLIEFSLNFISFEKLDYKNNAGSAFQDAERLRLKWDMTSVQVGVKYIF